MVGDEGLEFLADHAHRAAHHEAQTSKDCREGREEKQGGKAGKANPTEKRPNPARSRSPQHHHSTPHHRGQPGEDGGKRVVALTIDAPFFTMPTGWSLPRVVIFGGSRLSTIGLQEVKNMKRQTGPASTRRTEHAMHWSRVIDRSRTDQCTCRGRRAYSSSARRGRCSWQVCMHKHESVYVML